MLQEWELREGWVTVICLVLMGLCVSWAYQSAAWVEGMAILQAVVLLGTLLGILLAKSRLPGRLALPLSLLAGWTWAAYLTAQVLSRFARIPQEEAVIQLSEFLRDLVLVPFTEGATADNHVFLFLLALMSWLLAHYAAWFVFRRQQVWWAIILWGAMLLINMTYAPDNLTVYLIIFLLAALMMVVRANLALYEEDWRRTHVNYSPDLISSFLRAGLMISLIAILLAWVAPVALASRPLQPFWDKIGEPWRRLQEESTRIFQNLNYQNEPPLIALGDRRMWFGGPVSLEDVPVADVEAEAGRYWRVMVFHEYTGDGWASSDPDIVLIGANEQDLDSPTLDLRFDMTQTVTVFRDWPTIEPLIAAAQPLRSELPLRASVTFLNQPLLESEYRSGTAWVPTPSEPDSVEPSPSPPPQAPSDPSAIYSRLTLFAGDSYTVTSSLTEVDRDSLREAGTDYPDTVVPRYLQLPDSLPERVGALAQQLTEGIDTPYDKAKAIESALRKFPYDDQIEGPGLTQDGVDYFLFEARAGYCDYYASAMVVLLRSVDVPARYVRGYSEGETEDGVYHLLESDGHAWPEVYFPGYGWIEFEPTGGEPALDRPGAPEPAATAEPGSGGTGFITDMEPDLLPDDFESGFDIVMPTPEPVTAMDVVGKYGPAAAVITGLVAVPVIALVVLRRRHIADLSIVERVYEDLTGWVRHLLGIKPLAHQTPNEFAGVVAERVPKSQSAVEQIASLYVQERFSGSPVSGEDAESAWGVARPTIWRHWLAQKLDVVRRIWRFLVPPKSSSPPESTET